MEENICLPNAYISILDAFSYHVGEELGHDSSGEPPHCECISLALLKPRDRVTRLHALVTEPEFSDCEATWNQPSVLWVSGHCALNAPAILQY